jgi:hypothetical protein
MKRSMIQRIAALAVLTMGNVFHVRAEIAQPALLEKELSHGMRTFLLNRGVPFNGRSNGTRKAMRAAAKRRRILARLPK